MQCRVCDAGGLDLVLDLGLQPWCNHFLRPDEVGREPRYPLRLVFCQECRTSQLDVTVPKETMFGNHTYLSGITRSLSEHFRRVAEDIRERFYPGDAVRSVLDIGSNDGTQLKCFQQFGWDVLGVESSQTTAKIASDAGVPTLQAFFNEELAQSLNRSFDVINASGVFFHLEELHSVTRGIQRLLDRDGVFVVQFLYMPCILRNNAFDQIYHEHLLYYSLLNIRRLLGRHGLELFDAYLSPIHGGSMIAFCGHPGRRPASQRLEELQASETREQLNEFTTYQDFARRVIEMRDKNVAYLQEARSTGRRVFGMGAPVKGNTLLNYFGITREQIPYLVERNPLRRGLFAPGSHIPIVIEDEFHEVPDIYYVLAWNFRTEILERYRALRERGVEFFFPVDAPGA